MRKSIIINSKDNVAVALQPLSAGETVEGVVLKENIEQGHKFAIKDITQNENVIKYSYPIGHALSNIYAGEWIHTHNIKTNLKDNLQYVYEPESVDISVENNNKSDVYDKLKEKTFLGYARKNGNVGVRNELWIVPTVGCVNGQSQQIVDKLKAECDCSGIDDIRAYTHNYGCSQLGEDLDNTRNALAALIKHPNAGGVLVLGLGCENNQMKDLIATLGEYDKERVCFLVAQEVEDEVETGFEMFKQLLNKVSKDVRSTQPLSKLTIGLKCGGSDGLSGITANPLVGAFSDFLIANGGTTILTEVPEMFGAETILMNRAINKDVFNKVVSLINDFKDYFRKYDQPIYENPSPGNKKGGITTLEDKSLGCTQKGGSAYVVDVLKYTQPVVEHGLNLLNAPGNDLVAASSLALSGCQIVLFTTGRGTPFGSFVPTMKIATNSKLFNFKKNWLDFNAGQIVEDKTMNEVLKQLIDFVIAVADGKKLKHEISNFKELAIFKSGVTL
ncbi:altronate hydrolase [Bacteroidia bacterium]|nr:altronate hydrolase [Bacteroidia bacterium]